MVKNKQMRNAQINRVDEFYTRRETIEKELKYWRNSFKNKTVYNNCDTDQSEFVNYFKDNFKMLGLKRLIYSNYSKDSHGHCTIYTPNESKTYTLKGNGAFNSQECVELLKHSDIVVTNPPFSMQKEFQKLMFKEHKDYLILGNMNNALTPYVKELIGPYSHFGYSIRSGGVRFNIPCNMANTDKVQVIDGKQTVELTSIRWITNMPVTKPSLHNGISCKGMNYETYTNYKDAININRIKDIPDDYYGPMGVPVTIMDYWNDNEWEFLQPMVKPRILKNGVETIIYYRLKVKRKKYNNA